MERTTRRRLLLAAGMAAAGAGCLGRLDAADDPDETPARTETPAWTGTADGTATETPADGTTESGGGAGTPAGVAWRSEVGSPVTVVVAGSDAAYVGTEAGEVVALAGDGTERWTASPDGPIQGVERAGDLAFAVVGNDDLYAHQRVVAFDAATGERRWTFAPEEWWLEVLGSHDGTAYVATSDDAIAPAGQTLYAVSTADGTSQWSAEVGDESGGLVTPEAVYVPTFGRVYAYGHDGDQRWTHDVAGYGHNSLVAVGDTVAFAADDDENDRRQVGFGRSATDGSERWTVDDWFVTSFAAHGGRLFAGGERVVELDPATGETAWQFDPGGSIYDAPVADGALFTSGQSVHAVELADGARRWTFETDLHLPDPVAAVGDVVYVHASTSRDDRNRHVLALGHEDGDERWRFDADAPLTEPVLAGDRPVAASEDGVVYGFE